MTTPQTGRTLVESVAHVRIADTMAPNDRVSIHVEHPAHDGGVRCFYRYADSDVAATLRRHLRQLSEEIARVEIVDDVGLGLSEWELVAGVESDGTVEVTA